MVLNEFAKEVTIGFIYRFLYVTTPIAAPQSLLPSRPHTANPVRILTNFSYYLDFGIEIDKLAPINLQSQCWVYGLQWYDLITPQGSGDAPTSLIFKSDMPAPIEIIAVNLSYSGG